jgi:hypothetical protein
MKTGSGEQLLAGTEGCIKVLDAHSLELVSTIVTSNLGDSLGAQYLHPIPIVLKSVKSNQIKSFGSFSHLAFLDPDVFDVILPSKTNPCISCPGRIRRNTSIENQSCPQEMIQVMILRGKTAKP